MKSILSFKASIEEYIQDYLRVTSGSIYEPVNYIMELGGKRLRPCLLVSANKSFGGSEEQCMHLAAAIEVFHNFTLLHDDIMDEADTRRGKPSVHLKWNQNQAILSGDIMFAMSYELLANKKLEAYHEIHKLFTQTAKEVCIGQQMDMEFESQTDVRQSDYIEMIRLKTSVLIGASAAIGAMAAGASETEHKAMYDFGQYLGLSFQMQDDLLDAFGDASLVGKKVGGDILQNKKTLLYLKTKELASGDDLTALDNWYDTTSNSEGKVVAVKRIMQKVGADKAVRKEQESFLNRALASLKQAGVQGEWKSEFESLAAHQLERKF